MSLLVQDCFVFGNDAQRNANKGTEHPDESPLTLLDTKNVLTKLLTPQTVSLYLTRAIGDLSSNNMALAEIALFICQTNDSLVSEDCWSAVQLSRRI